jgi:hypothetical protein
MTNDKPVTTHAAPPPYALCCACEPDATATDDEEVWLCPAHALQWLKSKEHST